MREAHDMYLGCPDDDSAIKWAQQWYNSRDKVCVSIEAKYYWLKAKAKAAALEVKAKFF